MLWEYGRKETDLKRKAMFFRLAKLKESGAIYTPSTEGGNLHYKRKE